MAAMTAFRRSSTMSHRVHSVLLAAVLATALLASPLAAGELLIPLSAGTAADGTNYATRVWITNTGGAARRWFYSYLAPGTDGTQAGTGTPVTVGPGATVLATRLGPAGQGGMLYINGAPQLLVTARLEATAPDGSLRAAVAGPLVGGHDLAAGHGTLHLHGLSHRQGGLITDLYLINASRAQTQCTLDAFRDDGSRIATGVPYTLLPLSVRVVERALAVLGATNLDEARFAITCDQSFYAYARVYKPGGAELNLMTPSPALSH